MRSPTSWGCGRALRADREPILATVPVGEADDTFVVGDERTGEFDGGGNQQPVGRVAAFKVMEPIRARRRTVA